MNKIPIETFFAHLIRKDASYTMETAIVVRSSDIPLILFEFCRYLEAMGRPTIIGEIDKLAVVERFTRQALPNSALTEKHSESADVPRYTPFCGPKPDISTLIPKANIEREWGGH